MEKKLVKCKCAHRDGDGEDKYDGYYESPYIYIQDPELGFVWKCKNCEGYKDQKDRILDTLGDFLKKVPVGDAMKKAMDIIVNGIQRIRKDINDENDINNLKDYLIDIIKKS